MTQAANLAALGTNVNSSGIAQAAGGGTAGTAGVTGFKNRIINGAMVIDQRNAGASVTISADSIYTLDRFIARADSAYASKYSVQQNAGSITPPVGFTNYLGVTSLSAYSSISSNYYWIGQIIEGYNVADLNFGSANAKTVTLSFWVYSSLTGTFSGALVNGGFNRSYAFTYSIPTANTWTQISVTIAGDTSGTWLTTNGVGFQLRLNLGSGSSSLTTANSWQAGNFAGVTGSVSVVGTNGATFYITGVQLEVGTAATNFDFRSYGTELALCQRYFFSIKGTGYAAVGAGISISTTETRVGVQYPVLMRAVPTTSYTGTLYVLISGGSGITITSQPSNYSGTQSGMVSFGVASGLTTGDGALVITDNSGISNAFNASAEL